MPLGPIEIDHRRPVRGLGVWSLGDGRFKAYALLARDREIADTHVEVARRFLQSEVAPRIDAMGDSNHLGFVILHPGDLGLSISALWWAQGSVLCQHIYRKEYDAAEPMDTVSRPVIGCVWELDLIGAEKAAWRRTMMTDRPDPEAYLQALAPSATLDVGAAEDRVRSWEEADRG